MRKIILIAVSLVFLVGCGSSSREFGGTISSSSTNGIGSLSGDEDFTSILRDSKFSKIDIDLDKYKYDIDSGMKSYEIDMTFDGREVTGLADCNRFSANYKIKDDELSFSKVHFELASDLATCQGFIDADDAINSFLSSSYTLAGSSDTKLVLESFDIDTTVILSH